MPARRGSIYIIVLATTLVVVVLGLGALAARKADSMSRQTMREEVQARRLAASALELALQRAQNTSAWRSSVGGGAIFTDVPFGGGYVSASVADPVDGTLTGNTTDPLQFTATGRIGSARQVATVTASVNPIYVTALQSAMHAKGNVTITSATIRSPSIISTDGNFTASSATVKADVSAAGYVTGSTFSNTNLGLQSVRVMPDATTIAQYSAMATTLSYNSLDSNGRFRRAILSANTNSWGGALNSSGVYKIDCGGLSLTIEDSRIIGTLIVTNTSGVTINSSVNMSPWESGYPALLVSGNLTITTVPSDLLESSFRNFNPTGSPYNGVTDSDTADRYPSMIQGIVYVTGGVTIQGTTTIVGALVSEGAIDIRSGSTVTLWRQITGNPPGFTSRTFVVDSTTWARGLN